MRNGGSRSQRSLGYGGNVARFGRQATASPIPSQLKAPYLSGNPMPCWQQLEVCTPVHTFNLIDVVRSMLHMQNVTLRLKYTTRLSVKLVLDDTPFHSAIHGRTSP